MNKDQLKKLAEYLNLDVDALTKAANEAPFAERREDGPKWMSGSGSEGERRVLYALVRLLKPEYVVEFGTQFGASTAQIASALKANKHGRMDTVDEKGIIFGVHQVGKFIPNAVRDVVGQVKAKAEAWLLNSTTSLEFIFEDTDHTAPTTEAIYRAALNRLQNGGVIISHDATNHFGIPVITGIKATGIQPIVVKVDDDACGLAVYRKVAEKTVVKPIIENVESEDESESEETPQKTSTRPRRKKKASSNVA